MERAHLRWSFDIVKLASCALMFGQVDEPQVAQVDYGYDTYRVGGRDRTLAYYDIDATGRGGESDDLSAPPPVLNLLLIVQSFSSCSRRPGRPMRVVAAPDKMDRVRIWLREYTWRRLLCSEPELPSVEC